MTYKGKTMGKTHRNQGKEPKSRNQKKDRLNKLSEIDQYNNYRGDYDGETAQNTDRERYDIQED
jgi:hypothetical protein